MNGNQERDDLPENQQEGSQTSDLDKRREASAEEKIDRDDEREVHRPTKKNNSKETFFY